MSDDDAWNEVKNLPRRDWELMRAELWTEPKNKGERLMRQYYGVPQLPPGSAGVRIDEVNLVDAVDWAKQRHQYNLEHQVQEKHQAEGQRLDWQVIGQLGQMGLALFLDIPWEHARKPLGDFAADGIGRITMRTRNKNYPMILHPEHHKFDRSRAYVLGLAHLFNLHDLKTGLLILRGWVWGHEAVQRGSWFTPVTGRKGLFIEQTMLNPMKDLPAY
jgi:hypothetical protein